MQSRGTERRLKGGGGGVVLGLVSGSQYQREGLNIRVPAGGGENGSVPVMKQSFMGGQAYWERLYRGEKARATTRAGTVVEE